jgi:VWFA-related protein
MKNRILLSLTLGALLTGSAWAQDAPASPPQQQPQKPTPTTSSDDAGPQQQDNGSIVLKKKKDQDAPPPAPADDKVANPNGQTFSLRVDVPIVNLDVSVILDQNHQFVPGLKAENFLVVEDGKEQEVTSLRTTKVPITAVMLLEFASTSYPFLQDMYNSATSFYRTLQPDDYVAVATYDLRTHILCDFTNNKDVIRSSLQSLMIPTFHDTNEFDALYETLDRLSRVEGRKYIILISSGRDTFSKLTLDQMLAKIKATPDVTIFTISTGGFAQQMSSGVGPRAMDLLQADNEMKTFAQMTGGLHFKPVFQGELPDIFGQINESIRNQYVLTYRPTNTKNDGSYRKVKVYLVDNEGKPMKMQDQNCKSKNCKPLKYSVIARDGYRAKLPVE